MQVKDVGRCWLISFKKKWDAKIDEGGGHLPDLLELAILERKEPWPAPGLEGEIWIGIIFLKYIKKMLNYGSHFWVQIWTQKWAPLINFYIRYLFLGPDLDPKIGT